MAGHFLQWVVSLGVLAIGLPLPLPADAAEPPQPFPATVFNNTTILIFPPYRDLVELVNNSDRAGRNYTYFLYQSQKPMEVVAERDGDRILLVQRAERGDRQLRRQGQVRYAVQLIGLPSRVFPGLTGVQVIPPEMVPNLGAGDWGLEVGRTPRK